MPPGRLDFGGYLFSHDQQDAPDAPCGHFAAIASFAFAGSGGSALAGNIWLTGHDADYHCASQGKQCNHFGVALDFARQGAPDKTRPLLFLDKGSNLLRAAADKKEARAKNTVEGPDKAFSFEVMDPNDPSFAVLPLSTDKFSAIVIASDSTCNGCDLNVGDTADSEAINKRAKDIAAFFNAGGGLVYFSGAENRNVYYKSVPIPATASPVARPFTLTDEGRALGLKDDEATNDTNCCETHNSFEPPPAGDVLRVAEYDNSRKAETLFGRAAVISGEKLTTAAGHVRDIMEGLMDSATLVLTFGFLAFMVERLTNGVATVLGYWEWWRARMEVSPLADEATRLRIDRNRRVGLFGVSLLFSVIGTLATGLNLLAQVPAFANHPIAGSIVSGLLIAAGADPIREYLKLDDRKDRSREDRQPTPVQVTGTLIIQQGTSAAAPSKDEPKKST